MMLLKNGRLRQSGNHDKIYSKQIPEPSGKTVAIWWERPTRPRLSEISPFGIGCCSRCAGPKVCDGKRPSNCSVSVSSLQRLKLVPHFNETVYKLTIGHPRPPEGFIAATDALSYNQIPLVIQNESSESRGLSGSGRCPFGACQLYDALSQTADLTNLAAPQNYSRWHHLRQYQKVSVHHTKNAQRISGEAMLVVQ
jgi:hypothetical protein